MRSLPRVPRDGDVPLVCSTNAQQGRPVADAANASIAYIWASPTMGIGKTAPTPVAEAGITRPKMPPKSSGKSMLFAPEASVIVATGLRNDQS